MNDLISRQAAIKLLEEWANGYSYLEVPVSSIAPKLNELPTAEITLEQVEEYCRPRCLVVVTAEIFYAVRSLVKKKGRWIRIYNDIDDFCQCSECGVYGEPTYYCPNCGAKMEEL